MTAAQLLLALGAMDSCLDTFIRPQYRLVEIDNRSVVEQTIKSARKRVFRAARVKGNKAGGKSDKFINRSCIVFVPNVTNCEYRANDIAHRYAK
jgi:hypothetical protein